MALYVAEMILPTVNEISHERAVELQRQWQLVAAEQAKVSDASALKSGERR
jgi:hypothetical protein